jgi:hypothetical protein
MVWPRVGGFGGQFVLATKKQANNKLETLADILAEIVWARILVLSVPT